MSGPPDKWFAFSTLGLTSPEQLATKLSNLWLLGYDGPVVAVPAAPETGDAGWWIAVAGYDK
jgi:hypothetical protein